MDCLVLLSGGQDSATCLALVFSQGMGITTVSFDYGQRHKVELEMAEKLSGLANAKAHYVLKVPTFTQLDSSALVNSVEEISTSHKINSSLPASFVPGRNYIFLGFAAALAYKLGINLIYTGVCQTDYSGYPDCRHQTILSIQDALRKSMDFDILVIRTPLMYKTKKETVLLMKDFSKLDWYRHTNTCYEGKRPACGICPACHLRIKGFKEAGIKDPLEEVVNE